MKKYLFIVAVFLSGLISFAQEKESIIIANSCEIGDVKTISGYFPSSLDMTILEIEDVFSKVQATQMLTQFFKSNIPSNFDVQHKGASKGGDYYQIGTLLTNNGEYRVTIFLKKDDGQVFIKRFKIEANEGNF
jgi:hypothetical protein